jgi:hypothetical protein
MRSKTVLVISFLAFLCFPTTQSQAGSFTDNFNDGNADGWVFPGNPVKVKALGNGVLRTEL